jgi:phosphate ABC transporter phosphate-binding protein
MLDNPSTGEFVEPTIQTIAKTVDYIALTLPKGDEDWSEVSIIVSFFELSKTNKNLSGAFPVVSFVYVFIYKELSKVPGMTKEKAKALVEFLRWLVKDGQQYAEPLYYVPLPLSRIVLVSIIVAVIIAAGVAYVFVASNQNQGTNQGATPTQKIRISGAGSTFVAFFMQTAAYYYAQKYSVEVDYASIGSGGGIKQFLEKTVDFGASDAPLPRSEWEKAGDALHIPVVIGAVVVIYNIPDLPSNTRLKFTGQIVADIYLGKITKWNDPALVSLNPQLANIDKPITVVHRSDGSGTTYIFTQYLSVVSKEWAEKVGYSTSVNWPAPNKIGGKGNEGVAGVVQNTPYTIGYVEFTYAVKNNIPYGMLDNPSTGERYKSYCIGKHNSSSNISSRCCLYVCCIKSKPRYNVNSKN